MADAGFEAIVIEQKEASKEFIKDWLPGSGCEDYVVSANVTATKPGGSSCCQPGDKAAAASMAEAGVLAAKEAADSARAEARAEKAKPRSDGERLRVVRGAQLRLQLHHPLVKFALDLLALVADEAAVELR